MRALGSPPPPSWPLLLGEYFRARNAYVRARAIAEETFLAQGTVVWIGTHIAVRYIDPLAVPNSPTIQLQTHYLTRH